MRQGGVWKRDRHPRPDGAHPPTLPERNVRSRGAAASGQFREEEEEHKGFSPPTAP